MAKDIYTRIPDMNKTSAIRTARTAVTGKTENVARGICRNDGVIKNMIFKERMKNKYGG